MGGLRRIRRLLFSKPIQFLAICLAIYGAIKWVIHINYQDPRASRIRPIPTSGVRDRRIDWKKFQYVQFVTSAESLCNSMMIWHSFEELENGWQHIKYRANVCPPLPHHAGRGS
jgi:hypothetical protein